MTTILVSNLLFKNPTSIPVKCVSGMKLGAIGPAGVGISSTRKDGSITGAKLSAVALVLDAIRDGKVSAIEGESHVFVKYNNSDGVSYQCIANTGSPNSELRFFGKAPELNWEKLIPLFVLETREDTENKELWGILDELSLPGHDLPENILKLCDSFYYGSSQRKSVNIYEDEGTMASVEAATRSGLLKKNHEILSKLHAPEIDSAGISLGSERKAKTTGASSIDATDGEFEQLCAGKSAIAYPWNEEQQKRIPSLKTLEDFVPTAAFWKGSRKIKYRSDKILERLDMGLTGLEALAKDTINFFMTGKPGTGKTTVAKALAAAYQLPFYSIPIQKGTEEGTFQGLLKARDGKFVFTSTDFLDAFKNGGVIVLEELNLADPAVLSGAIGQAIESPYYVMEDDITPVYRHPLCIIIGTFNVGTAGSKEINPMLSSRFYQTYVVEDPDENEFEARLMKFDCDKRTAKKIYMAYSRILDYLKSPDVSAFEYCKNVTFRGCVGAIQCLQEGSSFKEAIEDTLVGKIAEYDLELAKDVLKNVVETLPD